MSVQRAVYTRAAIFGANVNALDPPEARVAPVAPLEREHQRARGFAAGVFGDQVVAFGGTFEQAHDARANTLERERFVFAFLCHLLVEPREQIDVRAYSSTNPIVHERSLRARKFKIVS